MGKRVEKENIVLLTVKDLAARWQCSERAVREYISDGTITPCKGVPGVKFHPNHISKLEGVEIERFSPLERKRMQREIDELREIVRLQSEQLRKVAALGTESMGILQKIV